MCVCVGGGTLRGVDAGVGRCDGLGSASCWLDARPQLLFPPPSARFPRSATSQGARSRSRSRSRVCVSFSRRACLHSTVEARPSASQSRAVSLHGWEGGRRGWNRWGWAMEEGGGRCVTGTCAESRRLRACTVPPVHDVCGRVSPPSPPPTANWWVLRVTEVFTVGKNKESKGKRDEDERGGEWAHSRRTPHPGFSFLSRKPRKGVLLRRRWTPAPRWCARGTRRGGQGKCEQGGLNPVGMEESPRRELEQQR